MTKLRDMREKFFCVNNEYLNGYAAKCGIYATGVYTELCRHASKEQTSFPSIQHIAEKLNISRDSVISAIKQLEKYNIIIAERNSGRVTEYRLADKSVWICDQPTSRPQQPVADIDYTSRPQPLPPVDVADPKNTNITKPIKKILKVEPSSTHPLKIKINLYKQIYKSAFNEDYVVVWGRDMKSLKPIEGMPENKFSALAEKFLASDNKFKGNCNIPSFVAAINRLQAKVEEDVPFYKRYQKEHGVPK